MAVIAGTLQYLGLPQLIDAAVADVGPVRRGILNQTHRAGGARTRFDAETGAEFDHFLVRPAE